LVVDLEDYSLARVIKGIYDSEYKTIATDSDGNIIGIFKGEYNEELITIKTDSQGRMLAIITDPEDAYGNIHMVGNAELAARLGSINTFDRRGDVIFIEDFEGPVLTWQTATNVDGSAARLSAAWPQRGSQCVELLCGAGAGASAGIWKYVPPSILGGVGLELSFTVDPGTTKYEILFIYYDGTNYHRAYVRYLTATDKFQYLAPGPLWTDAFTNLSLEDTYGTYHTIKIVMDTSINEWVRFQCDRHSINLAGVGLTTLESDIQDCLTCFIGHYSDHVAAKTAYVDNVIFTQNEPE